MSNKNTYDQFTPYGDKVFVSDMDRGMSITNGGIIIPDDDMRDTGIKPRWSKIHAIGPKVTDVAVGEWVLVEHGRWSQRISVKADDGSELNLWMIEYPKAVLLVSKTDPREHRAIAPELLVQPPSAANHGN